MVRPGKHLWELHPAVRSDGQLTRGERAADVLKHWFGTWTALGAVGATMAVYIVVQTTGARWDPYPFILLNLGLSCLAAVQGIILQISANRGDRISGEVALHTRDSTDKLLEMSERQLEELQALSEQAGWLEALGERQRALEGKVDEVRAAVGLTPPV